LYKSSRRWWESKAKPYQVKQVLAVVDQLKALRGRPMDSKRYTYRVTWSVEDNEYVGLCAEFPSLSWLDADQSKAFSGIVDLVAEVVADMINNKEKLPTALSEKKYSGRFAVRVPSMVHQKLALEAAERGVSMNRLVSAKLAM
jgi:predicted HicB family RNase H-like nuclease